MKALHWIAWILVVIGAINWGLVGLGMFMNSDWNVVHMILGFSMSLEALVYVLVGLSGLWLVAKKFMKKSDMPASMGSAMGTSSTM